MAIPKKASLTLIALAAMMTAPDFIPVVNDYRLMDWTMVPRVLDFQVRIRSEDPVGDEQIRLRPDTTPEKAETPKLVLPSLGCAIAAFSSFSSCFFKSEMSVPTETKPPSLVRRSLICNQRPSANCTSIERAPERSFISPGTYCFTRGSRAELATTS